VRALGAPLGEPFADDFHFLHHAMFGGSAHWLDGGGAVIYWRPLARQIYYDLLGPLMLAHPRWLATLHGVLLALAAVLVYRALCPRWPAWAAAAAASFPLIAEASRTLLLWPSAFQDLGALLFSALALHEASRRRLQSALAALGAGLLCKEIAVVTALLLPFMPDLGSVRERRRWVLAAALLVLAWGTVYLFVMRHAGLMFQRHLEAARPPLPLRMTWALIASLLDALSLGGIRKTLGLGMALVVGTLAIVAPLAALRSPETRARLRRALPWVAWGTAWFLASTATLSEVFPVWGPFRSAFGMLGFGIALCAWLAATGPAWLGVLVAARVAALLLSAGPPRDITPAPYDGGAPMDFESLVRLSRLTVQAREVLWHEHPTLPPHAVVVWHHRPLMAEHAFASGKALQVWYRDTTLRWVSWEEVLSDPARRLDVALEYQAHEARQVVPIAPKAMDTYRRALVTMAEGDYPNAIAGFAAADSLQRDRGAKAFLSTLAGKRAISALAQGEASVARRDAEQSLLLWHEAGDARYVLAVLLAADHRYAELFAFSRHVAVVLSVRRLGARVPRQRRGARSRALTDRAAAELPAVLLLLAPLGLDHLLQLAIGPGHDHAIDLGVLRLGPARAELDAGERVDPRHTLFRIAALGSRVLHVARGAEQTLEGAAHAVEVLAPVGRRVGGRDSPQQARPIGGDGEAVLHELGARRARRGDEVEAAREDLDAVRGERAVDLRHAPAELELVVAARQGGGRRRERQGREERHEDQGSHEGVVGSARRGLEARALSQ
jgi:hypothetical protein